VFYSAGSASTWINEFVRSLGGHPGDASRFWQEHPHITKDGDSVRPADDLPRSG